MSNNMFKDIGMEDRNVWVVKIDHPFILVVFVSAIPNTYQ